MSGKGIEVSLKDKQESIKDKKESLSCEALIKWRKITENETTKLITKLDDLRKTTTVINKLLWKKCDHNWGKVEGATNGDLCNKFCIKCKLYCVSSLYE